MKIYVSGPITGILYYKQRFGIAERKLKRMGHIVLNPANMPEGLTLSQYLSVDLPMLDCCDAIYLLDGYEYSVGCSIEFIHAYLRGMEVIYENKQNKGVHYQLLNAYKILTGEIVTVTPLYSDLENAIRKVYPEYCNHSFAEFGNYEHVNMVYKMLGLKDLSDPELQKRLEEIRYAYKKHKHLSEMSCDEKLAYLAHSLINELLRQSKYKEKDGMIGIYPFSIRDNPTDYCLTCTQSGFELKINKDGKIVE